MSRRKLLASVIALSLLVPLVLAIPVNAAEPEYKFEVSEFASNKATKVCVKDVTIDDTNQLGDAVNWYATYSYRDTVPQKATVGSKTTSVAIGVDIVDNTSINYVRCSVCGATLAAVTSGSAQYNPKYYDKTRIGLSFGMTFANTNTIQQNHVFGSGSNNHFDYSEIRFAPCTQNGATYLALVMYRPGIGDSMYQGYTHVNYIFQGGRDINHCGNTYSAGSYEAHMGGGFFNYYTVVNSTYPILYDTKPLSFINYTFGSGVDTSVMTRSDIARSSLYFKNCKFNNNQFSSLDNVYFENCTGTINILGNLIAASILDSTPNLKATTTLTYTDASLHPQQVYQKSGFNLNLNSYPNQASIGTLDFSSLPNRTLVWTTAQQVEPIIGSANGLNLQLARLSDSKCKQK